MSDHDGLTTILQEMAGECWAKAYADGPEFDSAGYVALAERYAERLETQDGGFDAVLSEKVEKAPEDEE